MIEATGLTKRFRTRRGDVTAVDGVDFAVADGEFVGYLGPNGAGKSTTIKMMCGVLVPTSGQLRVDGLVPWQDRRALTRRMGAVFGQRTQLWWDLPLRHSFRLVAKLYGLSDAVHLERVAELQDALGLDELLDTPVRSLSLGQRMRGELAAAVLPRPRVLFLDEPTIGLDVEAKAAVRTFLAALNREHGTTVILTTHDLGDIEQLCRRLLIIDKGNVIYDGAVTGLRATYATERVLVVDVADDRPVTAPDAEVVRTEGRRYWLRFAREGSTSAAVVGHVLANHDVVDLALEETSIEEIVRQIYREGRFRGGG